MTPQQQEAAERVRLQAARAATSMHAAFVIDTHDAYLILAALAAATPAPASEVVKAVRKLSDWFAMHDRTPQSVIENYNIVRDAALCATPPASDEVRLRQAMQELQNIANADPREWGETSDQFQQWARNRARHTLAALRAAQPESAPATRLYAED